MPKSEVDWGHYDEYLKHIPPPDVYKDQIGEEVARMVTSIQAVDRTPNTSTKLVSFATNSHLEDQYVRAAAVAAVFKRYHVLDDYYAGEDTAIATNTETTNGWEVALTRPRRKGGIFTVIERVDNEGEGRQTVRYGSS